MRNRKVIPRPGTRTGRNGGGGVVNWDKEFCG